MNTSNYPIDPLLQVLLSLSTYNTKNTFNNIGRKTGELYDQKKRTVVSDIVQKWGQSILGSCARVFWKCKVTWHLGADNDGKLLWRAFRQACVFWKYNVPGHLVMVQGLDLQ